MGIKTEYEGLEQAKEAAEACARLLKERFGARKVYVFGSAAGQSPWHGRSDIDLGVEGLAPEKYMAALSALYELLPEGLNVDLITLEDARPEMVARIKGGKTMPEEPKEALRQEITDELANMERVVQESKRFLKQAPDQPDSFDLRVGGSLVHDFYTAAERILERIAIRLGAGLPLGSGWHTLLLRQMESAVKDVRPEVIDHRLALQLLDYLRFRHIFRHSYGYELQWEKLRPLVEGMAETFARLREALERFLEKAP